MTPWCDDLVCSWRRLLADRHSPPFPWTLSLHRRWCPSASHHPVTFFFLPALAVPLPFPFLSLGLSLRRPRCPSASPHSFPFHSLGRLCQRSPRTCPVSLLCVGSTQRKANAFAVGQVRPSGHPKPAVRYLSPTVAGGPWDGMGCPGGEGGGACFWRCELKKLDTRGRLHMACLRLGLPPNDTEDILMVLMVLDENMTPCQPAFS